MPIIVEPRQTNINERYFVVIADERATFGEDHGTKVIGICTTSPGIARAIKRYYRLKK